MGLVLESTFVEILFSILLLCWAFYRYMTKDYDFWEQRGVPHRKAKFPLGSMSEVMKGQVALGVGYGNVYKEFEGERYCGLVDINRPVLLLRDPDLIQHVLVSDFNYFVDRNSFDVSPKSYIQKHLFHMNGEGWRNMRHKLSPAFTSGKMRLMFELMLTCGEQLRDYLDKQSQTGLSIDVKDSLAKFTVDVIATCAFGLDINSLKDENTHFYDTTRLIFKPTATSILKHSLITLFPSVAAALNIDTLNKRVTHELTTMVDTTVKFREQNKVSRNDFLDILIKLKHNKSILDGTEDEVTAQDNEGMTLEQMTAQAFIFFAAGFETASSTMTFVLYELARHPDIQERLYQEVEEIMDKHGGKITYQSLQEMKYMDQVINETLRMYSSLGVLHRRCTRRYQVPGSDLVLEKGQKVYIPSYGIHHDPQHYPEPYRFDPDRFSLENSKNRHPCVHLPFGTGPRICIGMRFGLMQTKVGLASFLHHFRAETTPETLYPMEFLPAAFVTQPKKPVCLKILRRQ